MSSCNIFILVSIFQYDFRPSACNKDFVTKILFEDIVMVTTNTNAYVQSTI